MMCAVANSGILFGDESAEQFSSRKVVERLNSYKSEPLHGYFFTLCNPIMDTYISFHWLKSGDLHAETEGRDVGGCSRSSLAYKIHSESYTHR